MSITTAAPESATYLRLVILSYCLRAVMIAPRNCASTDAWIRASMLVTSVDARHRRGLLLQAGGVPDGVDDHVLHAGLPAQQLVVRALDPGPADQVRAVRHRVLPGLLQRVQLVVVIGDR